MLKNKKILLSIAILWTCTVAFLSLVTFSKDIESSVEIPYKDKYVHFTFYFLFVIFWSFYFKEAKKQIIVLLAAIVFGILMEICQGLFTTTRTPDILDVAANSFGALVGLVFMKEFIKKKATHCGHAPKS